MKRESDSDPRGVPPGVIETLKEAQELLKDIEIYPGASWPNAYDIEGVLIRDCHERARGDTESPWAGGTLAAAKFIAAAPRLVRDLAALLVGPMETKTDDDLTRTGQPDADRPPQHASTNKKGS